jgi:hypothetical protein
MSESEIFEIPVGEIRLSSSERRGLLQIHERRDSELVETQNAVTGEYEYVSVPLDRPICSECQEPWGKWGCRAVRAAALLGVAEREQAKDARTVDELREALTPRFGVYRLNEAGNNIVAVGMQIDEYSLIHGGIGLVEATLERISRHWRAWFKHTGNLRRVRADHAAALLLDSEYYRWLTSEFDPRKTYEKPRGAPWDYADWKIEPGVAAPVGPEGAPRD